MATQQQRTVAALELEAEEAMELCDREELSSLLPPSIVGGAALPIGRDAGQPPLPTGQGLPTQSLPATRGVPQLGLPVLG